MDQTKAQETKRPELIQTTSQTVNIPVRQVQAVIELLEQGNTIPFIARYRKEMTGSLDEVQIHEINKAYQYASNLSDRKDEILRSIANQDKLTPELQVKILHAVTLQELEDYYLPFKQKRRTKAMVAIEQGLQPLADWILSDAREGRTIESKAEEFLTEEVTDVEAALAGAHEIIAQEVSDRADFRQFIRKYVYYNGAWTTQIKDADLDERKVYEMYYDFQEPLSKLVAHRILASNRAEKEGVISVKIQVDDLPALAYMEKHIFIDGITDDQKNFIANAIKDSFKRFIFPAIEREIRKDLTEKADDQAVKVFAENLKHLLLQAPLKGKKVLGLDPAYRTGCKLAVITETGQVETKTVIYPHKPASAAQQAKAKTDLIRLIQDYEIDIIAIGNGTASRESEFFVAEALEQIDRSVEYAIVNEAGASVYSASEIARAEFPDYQVEERSAVSIARRLQDPLAELIKIDPQAIGVGQYQHDVSQAVLQQELSFVVNTAVNQVGVDVNTASIQLLEHVSGMTATTAKNMIELRNDLSGFKNRQELKKVKRLGPKTYEQAVGFLRILDGENPLDQTSIHPESYPVAQEVLQDLGMTLSAIGTEEAIQCLKQQKASELAQKYQVGLESMEDILSGLMEPLKDIRDSYQGPLLRKDVLSMKDLNPGMILEGVVRNVVDFGVFVDIGVKQDGLIHLSKLKKKGGKFIKHPAEVLSVGDIIEVEILEVDPVKNRIGLKQI